MSHHNSQHERASHDHHGTGEELAPRAKLVKLLKHWMRHNEEHTRSYRQWAETADAQSMPEVALRLKEAAQAPVGIDRQFEAALRCVRPSR
jgi:hypothetical protein